jgi:hypothetical protein
MPSSWILALKEYNAKKGTWCMPRKGTAEHAEVKAIMEKMKGGESTVAKEKPKRKLRTEKETKSEMMAKEDKPEKKTRRKAESESDSDVPVAKPKARAEPVVKAEPKAKAVAKAVSKAKAKAPKMAYKGDKFVPQLRTGQEKQDYLEQKQLELMTEDFKKGLPLKLREKK